MLIFNMTLYKSMTVVSVSLCILKLKNILKNNKQLKQKCISQAKSMQLKHV